MKITSCGVGSHRSILLVEDDSLLRDLLARMLEGAGFIVETAATAADAAHVFHRCDPDGVILDVDLGRGPNGFDLADALLRRSPSTAILFLTNLPDPRFANRTSESLPSGIGYLRKSALSDADTLITAIDDVLRGHISSGVRHDRDPLRPMASLTHKQVDVLKLVADGKSNAQIAEIRGISVKSVEDTISRACLTLGIDPVTEPNTRVAAVRRFLSATGRAAPDVPEVFRE